MTFSAGLFDELTPCYPDTEAGTGKTEYRTAGANGTYAGVNILLDGLTPGIPVVPFSGDNPNSLVGSGSATPGMAGISLGTSDTFFAPMRDFKTDPQGCGHVFGNPAGGFMSLICFTNGSLARDAVRREKNVSWEFFDCDALRETSPGNGGRLLLPYFEPESTPPVVVPGVRRNYIHATPAEEIRAILESQALSLRLHSSWQGEEFRRMQKRCVL